MNNSARKFTPYLHAPESIKQTPQSATSIVSPIWDIFLVGGISLIIFLFCSVWFQNAVPAGDAVAFILTLGFFVNLPHFLVSYQLLYGDFRKEIFSRFRFFWAAVLVPILLGGFLVASFTASTPASLGYSLNAMLFFVGWHYVKQTFGAVVVSNAAKNVFYSKIERFFLKSNLYTLWMVSFFSGNIGNHDAVQDGIHYFSLNFPYWFMNVAYLGLAVSASGVVFTHLKKFINEGAAPSKMAVVSWLAIYVWLMPILIHPSYVHMIPMFHGLQYLLFVYSFRKNKVEANLKNIESSKKRKLWLVGIWGYLLGAVFLGVLASKVPPFVDGYFDWITRVPFTSTPTVFFITVFIK